MNDTHPEMRKKQLEIMLSKSPSERFKAGIEMIDFARGMVEDSIRNRQKDVSKLDLKKQVFLRYYSHEFTKKQIDEILNFFH